MKRKVYMSFFERSGLVVQFIELDGKTSVGKIRTLADSSRIREVVRRTRTPMNLEAVNMLDHAISIGRGGMYL